jgi:hypothetical protein
MAVSSQSQLTFCQLTKLVVIPCLGTINQGVMPERKTE